MSSPSPLPFAWRLFALVAPIALIAFVVASMPLAFAAAPAADLRCPSRLAQMTVADGVPPNAITDLGFGQTHLLVVTGPGVRQARNRRVEVIVR